MDESGQPSRLSSLGRCRLASGADSHGPTAIAVLPQTRRDGVGSEDGPEGEAKGRGMGPV